jgi:hypothetical protein
MVSGATSNVPSYYLLEADARGGPDHSQEIPRQHSLQKGCPSSIQRVIEALLHKQGAVLCCWVLSYCSYIDLYIPI